MPSNSLLQRNKDNPKSVYCFIVTLISKGLQVHKKSIPFIQCRPLHVRTFNVGFPSHLHLTKETLGGTTKFLEHLCGS